MTISANDRRYEYDGGNATLVFTGPRAFQASHIEAYEVDDVTGVATLRTDYTLTGVGVRNRNTTLTFADVIPAGTTLLILRTVPYEQGSDITNQGPYLPQVVEDALDGLSQQLQQVAEGVARSFRAPDTATGVEPIGNTPNRYVVTDADGKPALADDPPAADLTLRNDIASSASGKGAALVAFQQSGVSSAINTVLSKLHELPSVMDKIPVAEHAAIYARTSTYDCTAAIQQAVTDYPRCRVPAGKFVVSGTVTIPAGHEVFGGGELATTFARGGSALSFFVMGTNSGLHNVGFTRTGAVTALSGRLIDVGISGAKVSGIYADHCWDGIYVTSCAGLFLDRIYINNWQNAGIHVNGNTNDVLLSNFILTSGTTGTGIKLYDKVEAFIASNGDVIGGAYGMTTDAAAAFDPYTSRVFPQYNKLSNVYFDSSVNGVDLEKANVTTFTNCWFATSANGPGCDVGLCYSTTFDCCDFFTNGGSGLVLSNASQKHTKVIGGNAINNNLLNAGQNGVTVNAGVSDFSILGLSAYNSGGTGQGYGVFISAGASDRYVVQGCNLTGNVVGGMSDAGTGTNKRVGANVGYTVPTTAPTLVNSWVDFGATYATAGYWKDDDGVVHLTGLLKSGVVGSAMFTLPAGFRPASREVFAVFSNGAIGQCDVDTNGQVIPVIGSNVNFSISGITFKAA